MFEIVTFVSLPLQLVTLEKSRGAGVVPLGIVSISGISLSPSDLAPSGDVNANPRERGKGHETMTYPWKPGASMLARLVYTLPAEMFPVDTGPGAFAPKKFSVHEPAEGVVPNGSRLVFAMVIPVSIPF